MIVFELALAGYCMGSSSLSLLYSSTLKYGKLEVLLLGIIGLVASAVASPIVAGLSQSHSPRTLVLGFSTLLGVSCLCHCRCHRMV